VEYERFPQRSWQPGNCPHRALEFLSVCGRHVGSWIVLGHGFDHRIDGKRESEQPPYASPAREVATSIERNCGKPRAKRAALVKPLQGQKRRHEYVLNRIKRVIGISEARKRNAVQDVPMPADDLAERAIPSGKTERHELIVGEILKVTAHENLR
jgi:hypothetical protein